MKEKRLGIFTMCVGISILLVTFIGMYYEFFVPKIGPLGSGERATYVYVIIINTILIGLFHTISGIVIWVKHRKVIFK